MHMKQLLQKKVPDYYKKKLKIAAHPVFDSINEVDFDFLYTDIVLDHIQNAYDSTSPEKSMESKTHTWPSLFDIALPESQTNYRITVSGDRGMGKTELAKYICRTQFPGSTFAEKYDHIFLVKLRNVKRNTPLVRASWN